MRQLHGKTFVRRRNSPADFQFSPIFLYQAYTTGINCERCLSGYYRPPGLPPDAEIPCLRCDCDPIGSFLTCDKEGTCACKPGYAGKQCNVCASGYRGYPNCEVCPCDPRGVISTDDCDGKCTCKVITKFLFKQTQARLK